MTLFLWILAAVHLLLTVLLLSYIADVAMPLYVFRPDLTSTFANDYQLSWLQLPLWARYNGAASSYSEDLARHRVDSSSSPLQVWELQATVLNRGGTLQISLAILTFVFLRFVMNAPYGRHALPSWSSFSIPSRLSWMLQEMPTVLNVVYFLLIEYPRLMRCEYAAELADPPSSRCCTTYSTCLMEGFSHLHIGLLLFVMHYIHRSFIFPLYIPSTAHPVPLQVTWSATLYCLFNGRLQLLANVASISNSFDRSFSFLQLFRGGDGVVYSTISPGTIENPVMLGCLCLLGFIAGSCLFFYGQWQNMRADYYLLHLRQSKGKREAAMQNRQDSSPSRSRSRGGRTGQIEERGQTQHSYQIPYGLWFTSVSCANFFGEIVEWVGYAMVVTSSTALSPYSATLLSPSATAALSFVLYVLSNLLPRAAAHHRWYEVQFGDAYRRLKRKAVLPGIY